MDEIFKYLEALKDKIVIVEGKKDTKALAKYGVQSTEINGSLEIFAESIAKKAAAENKTVVLLLDLDPTGRKIYTKLNHYLNQMGIHIDNEFRHYLFKETKLRQIEGLDTYIEKIEKIEDGK